MNLLEKVAEVERLIKLGREHAEKAEEITKQVAKLLEEVKETNPL